jgi:hypothetical protein
VVFLLAREEESSVSTVARLGKRIPRDGSAKVVARLLYGVQTVPQTTLMMRSRLRPQLQVAPLFLNLLLDLRHHRKLLKYRLYQNNPNHPSFPIAISILVPIHCPVRTSFNIGTCTTSTSATRSQTSQHSASAQSPNMPTRGNPRASQRACSEPECKGIKRTAGDEFAQRSGRWAYWTEAKACVRKTALREFGGSLDAVSCSVLSCWLGCWDSNCRVVEFRPTVMCRVINGASGRASFAI